MDKVKPVASAAGLVLFCLMLSSCASWDLKREVQIPKETREVKAEKPAPPVLKAPEFVPAAEDVSPIKTRIVDIVARQTPLRDVLHVIAEATSLNVVAERDVNMEMPVTLTLRNVTAENALNTIFASVDYFYSIKDNMLIIKAVDSRMFELGHPSVIQNYSVDLGGDILGGATTNLASSSSGSTGSSSSASSSNVKGSITQNLKSDTAAFGFWDALDRTLAGILRVQSAQQPVAAAASQPGLPQQQPQIQQMLQPAASANQSFVINRLTGTIFVTATKRNLEKVEQYLNTIKKVIGRQVLIEAKIIEVQLNDGLKFGIDWNFMKNLNWSGVGTLNSSTTTFSSVLDSTSPSFNFSLTGSNFDALLKALQTQGEVRTLSNPRVNIMNGQTALLNVGRNVSFVSKVETTTTAGVSTPTTTYTVETNSVLSGIIIGLVPYINENGEISLTITPIVSDLVSLLDKTIGSSGQNQIQISLPTVDLRQMSTTVRIKDNQLVVIGGLISKKESLEDSKVPVLGDLPVLGGLFTRRDKLEKRSELVIVLQPVIVSR
ncbi:MAG: pilus (MSHA type) biogenesis protein MshL [Nitrospiraceae bacterium]|nr:pilus (MSHA type) biogenesis protein MshL [Nitrospiraceae bacterium]